MPKENKLLLLIEKGNRDLEHMEVKIYLWYLRYLRYLNARKQVIASDRNRKLRLGTNGRQNILYLKENIY